MASVFMMRHHGVQCAVPAAQVIAVVTDPGDVERLEFWPDVHPLTPERFLHVHTARGERVVSCLAPCLLQLAASEVFALPALVQRESSRRFIVGIARAEPHWLWLVDLRRF